MHHQMPPTAPIPPLVSPFKLAPFVDPLPIMPNAHAAAEGHLRIAVAECEVKIHRDIPPTRMWGCGGTVPGVTVEARTGQRLTIEWQNELPTKHFLPVDHTLMGAERANPEVRTVIHVHGAKAPPESDGWPMDWTIPGQSKTYVYPNQQDAAMLWYHDHAMGINRLNIMAGIAGFYIIRDDQEDSLNLPKNEFEIPMVLMDRMIASTGQLYYPVSQRPEAPWVPEFFGDHILVNGKIFPYAEVRACKYRIRVLNASNARTFVLSLANSGHFHQIGTGQGLLRAPVLLSSLSLGPGERADLIMDFSAKAGETIVLQNNAFPILQFRVGPRLAHSGALPSVLRSVERTPESAAVRTRTLSLRESDNLLAEPMIHLLDGKRWHDPISENPVLDSTEIWSFINSTQDMHPIHLHLVRFQILDRRPFDPRIYADNNVIQYTSAPVPRLPNEDGWKDTVQVTPGSVTRIIAEFKGYPGKYVWHCHILEHEDNEMMRPYEVVRG